MYTICMYFTLRTIEMIAVLLPIDYVVRDLHAYALT